MRLILLAAPLLLANVDSDKAPPAPAQEAQGAEIPPQILAMLKSAMSSGNENDVSAIARYAAEAAPDAGPQILKIAADWKAERVAKANLKVEQASFFALVKGRAELGGFITTGNTENTGLSAVIDLKREDPVWRHKLHLQADYQRSLGVTTREHYLAAYEPNFRLSPRAYVYGAAQYESDRFLGYTNRFSVSAGAGYSAIHQPGLTLDLELGPAYRDTSFTDGVVERSIAARGSLDFGWKLSHGISLTQNASAYIEAQNSTMTSKSALGAKLIGPLSAQLSYTMQYESMPPTGAKTTDTTSRASLVLDF
jgi:putative salt-induced outer membrane protein